MKTFQQFNLSQHIAKVYPISTRCQSIPCLETMSIEILIWCSTEVNPLLILSGNTLPPKTLLFKLLSLISSQSTHCFISLTIGWSKTYRFTLSKFSLFNHKAGLHLVVVHCLGIRHLTFCRNVTIFVLWWSISHIVKLSKCTSS